MTTVLLIRHGRSVANTAGVLAGRGEGVELDDTGRDQATDVARRLAGIDLAAAVTSPILRCQQTTELALAEHPDAARHTEDRLTECDYGDWTGSKLSDLATEDLWKVVQRTPSAATFPGGESMPAMSARAAAAIRGWDARIGEEHGPTAAWVAVSHGDVIKAILADALGLHLDLFQRIVVDPASVSMINFTAGRASVITMNSTGADLAAMVPKAPAKDAAVGGGLGSAQSRA